MLKSWDVRSTDLEIDKYLSLESGTKVVSRKSISKIKNSVKHVSSRDSLKVYYTNSRSLRNKIDELRAVTVSEDIDIICISETWAKLDKKQFRSEFSINGYKLYNTDRSSDRKGGGVMVYIRDDLNSCIKSEIKTCQNSETIWVNIRTDRENIVLGVVYRPPNLDRINSKIIYDEITKASRFNRVYIVGDFNFRNINWVNITGDADAEEFLEVVQNNFLTQHVLEATRGNNILDLVFSNMENSISNLDVGEFLGNSDHRIVRFNINLRNSRKDNTELIPNFRRGDFEGLRTRLSREAWEGITLAPEVRVTQVEGVRSGQVRLSQDPSGINQVEEVRAGQVRLPQTHSGVDLNSPNSHSINMDQEYDNFVETLKNIQKEFIPMKQRRSKKNDPNWMNNRIKYLLGTKKGIYRRLKRGEENLRQQYVRLNREVKKKIREAKRNHEIKIASEVKINPKSFYQQYQTKLKERVGPLETDNGHVTDDDKEMCDCLNEYFLSVFTKENLEYIPEVEAMYASSPENILSKINISREDVIKELNRLKAHKSPGPDEVYARVLKECKAELSCPLTSLFNNSLKSGWVPKAWKLADVVPIFKKGEKIKKSNYRPVSLTSTVGKILESIIANKIRDHLEKHKLIKLSQFGFLKGFSCLTNLLSFYSEVFESVDNNVEYDAVFLDFSKAFDKVPHERLIRKIEAHGIGGDVLRWIKEWLKDRKQRVCLNGEKSDWGAVTSGVPQGSVLGPLLFIMYLNDLDTGITSNLSKFADDTKIGRSIRNLEDSQALQGDLDRLYDWSVKWQMKFNIDKCKVIKMGSSIETASYKLNNIDIVESHCERDLGVLISSDLKPREQCIAVRNKANKILGFISRSVNNRSEEVILKLYLALVRPHLDYAVQFWSPYYRTDIDSLERVQRRMTKMIHNIRNLPYEERLKRLNLHSLERRRVRGDMIEVFKWFKGINKGDINRVLKLSNHNRTRSNGYKLDKFRFRKDIGKNWFGNRVVDTWNSLPNTVVSANTLDTFKNRLDTHMTQGGWV